jgi:hypothetical protein
MPPAGATRRGRDLAHKPDRLAAAIGAAGTFALLAWSAIDPSQRITDACAAVGIPNASMRVFGRASGSSISTGGAMRLPDAIVEPDPPFLLCRADIGTDKLSDGLTAALERVFRDVGAISGL